jgi:NAD(P)-dependent dehydrogenase (short-subunit alcohol dehydrogenase family)
VLVDRFAQAGMQVAMAARSLSSGKTFSSTNVRSYPCDATDPQAVKALFETVETDLGPPDLVVFNVGTWRPGSILEIKAEELEQAWRVACLGGFIVGQVAARGMVERGQGTILFSGATASIRGSANFAALAIPKFGLRALAQSMARELGSKGVHVAHIIIDGHIGASDGGLKPLEIADVYYVLHQQPRSVWTHEIDLRAWNEPF